MNLLDDVPMAMSDIHNPNELVRENLRRLLARNAVKRGTRWIQDHADNRGWWRNCLNNGTSRVRTNYTSEGILALVFEYRPEFADNTHYINEGKITRHFNLSPREIQMCGFFIFGKWRPFPERYPDVWLSGTDMDRAWADLLENPPSMWRKPAKHWESYYDYWDEPKPLRLQLLNFVIKILDRLRDSIRHQAAAI